MMDQVDDSKRVIGSEAVVRDIGGAAVGGCDHLVGIMADRDAHHHLQVGGIDHGESVVVLGEDKQGSVALGIERAGGKAQRD